ncbi:MAG: hypothetical protein ACRD5H_08300 [Nitrososphaerales archaeon]
MLGEQIYEAKGKLNGVRIVDVEGPEGAKMETSYTIQGTIKGIEVTEMGTFTSVRRSENVEYGEDRSCLMATGGSTAAMLSRGIGHPNGSNKMSYRGFAIVGQSNTGKLAFLNNLVIAFEAEVDGDNLSVKGWEWK